MCTYICGALSVTPHVRQNFLVNRGIVGLSKLVFSVVIIAHLVACAWHGVVPSDVPLSGTTWVDAYGIRGATTGTRYVVALYWAVTTMVRRSAHTRLGDHTHTHTTHTHPLFVHVDAPLPVAPDAQATVGFGDVVPHTTAERAVAMLTLLVGASLFGYIVGNVASYIREMTPAATLLRQRMDDLKDFAAERGLPAATRRRLMAHFLYVYSRKPAIKEAAVTEMLPYCLRADISRHNHADNHFVELFHHVNGNVILSQANPLQVRQHT